MDKSSPVAMVADPRGVVVSVASTVLAGVGFLLSVFSVVLSPLIPVSPAELGAGHKRPLSVQAPSSADSSSVDASSSSKSSARSSPTPTLHSRARSQPDAQPGPMVYTHGAPLKRSPMQRSIPSPTSTAIDYFSPEAPSATPTATSTRTRVNPRRLASDPVILTSAPTHAPIPIQSTASAPIVEHANGEAFADGTDEGLETFTTSPFTSPQVPAYSPSSNPKRHSFRFSHLKRPQSATSPREKSFCRSVTSPDILSPQACCSKAGEKILRKSTSSPDTRIGNSKSRWKSTRQKAKNCSPSPLKISLPCPSSSLSSPPLPPARSRTQPYEAPYFFPTPGSPEAVDYVRRMREEKSGRPLSVQSHLL